MNGVRYMLAAAAAAAMAGPAGAKTPTYSVRGPAALLHLFTAAAHTCGYGGHVHAGMGSDLDKIVVMEVPDTKDPKFKCVWKWLDVHHDKNLSINRSR